MNSLIWIVLIVAIAFLGYLAVGNVDTEDELGLTLNLIGLEALEVGHYEGWAIYGDEKVSTGKFNIGDDMNFQIERDVTKADKIVITIEPEGDVDNEPSGVVVLAGEVAEDGSVDLSFPLNFSATSGSFILATPTNGPDTDEASGVWFLALPEPPEISLFIPPLVDGWVYEGWAVNNGTPLSTGRFSDPKAEDGFNGYSGEESAPPFPGEDFLLNPPDGVEFPINLADGSSLVVISVEPDIDGVDPTGNGPFSIKPFVTEIPEGALDHENIALGDNFSTVPSGTAIVK